MLSRWRRGWRALTRGAEVSREMEAEMDAHVAYEVDELIAQGMDPAEARRQALVSFGGKVAVREEAHGDRALHWVADLGRDLGQSWRGLKRAPFAAAALTITAALGIGSLSAVFSVINAAWLRPLPYAQPSMLHGFSVIAPTRALQTWVSPPVAIAIRELLQPVSRVAEYATNTSRVEALGVSGLLPVTQVDSALLSVLRVGAVAGRLPTAAEFANAARVVLVRDSVWRRLPKADRARGTATIRLDGQPYTVVGSLKNSMHFPERSEVWIPLRQSEEYRSLVVRRDQYVSADSLESVVAAMNLDSRLEGWRVRATGIVDRGQKGAVAVGFSVLLLLASLLALATAANVAMQLVASAQRRRGEFATYAALGASPSRIARRLLANQVIIVGAAGVLGTLFAQLAQSQAVGALIGRGMPGWISLDLDWRTTAASMAFTAAMLAVVGVLPAREARRVDPVRAMREGAIAGVTAFGAQQTGRRLLATQLALSLYLAAVAGVLVLAYRQAFVAGEHPGDATRLEVSVYGASLRERAADEEAALLDTLQGLVERRALGIASRYAVVTRDGFVLPTGTLVHAVDEKYFTTVGRQIVAGRGLGRQSAARDSLVAVVSEGFLRAARLSLDAAIGHRVRRRGDGESWRVVGVVRDHGDGLSGGRSRSNLGSELFVPHGSVVGTRELLVTDAHVPIDTLRAALRAEAGRIAPLLELGRLLSSAEQHQLATKPAKLAARLATIAAAAVLLISLVGMHGVVGQIAVSRRAEAGIRIALGSTAWRVAGLLISESLRGVATGLIVGAVLSATTAVLLLKLLGLPSVGVALALISAATFVLASVLLACWVPIYQLLRAEPATLLRAN